MRHKLRASSGSFSVKAVPVQLVVFPVILSPFYTRSVISGWYRCSGGRSISPRWNVESINCGLAPLLELVGRRCTAIEQKKKEDTYVHMYICIYGHITTIVR